MTDRCNLNCSYCAPGRLRVMSGRSDLLSYEEITAIVTMAAELGVTKVRVTGGEPLARRGVGTLLTALSGIDGIATLGLTTNGTLLERHIPGIIATRFRRLNVSLDTLDHDRYRSLCGFDGLPRVLAGIRSALDAGLRLKLNAVCWPGFRISDALDLSAFGLERGMDVRFIGAMRVRGAGRVREGILDDVQEAIGSRWSLVPDGRRGSANLFRVEGSTGRIGIIAPSSSGFCEGCGRIRLSSTGLLRSCLFSRGGVDIREAARQGNRSAIKAALESIIFNKEAASGREGGVVQTMMGIGG
ncbi:MAG: radical SAM protein [Deltaproteobacteria bacterium]|nr:radical SAM protein [Deltaproteobacteria bacterium]